MLQFNFGKERSRRSGKTPRKSRTQSFTKPKLQPLKAEDLARRLGVNTETVEQEAAKGEEYFRAWSQSKDIGRETWEKRGNLYPTFRTTKCNTLSAQESGIGDQSNHDRKIQG